jgi:hypothetical protein
MYKIAKKDYGYKLIFSDMISLDEMNQWVIDSEKELLSAPSKFGVFVDMRELKPLSPVAQQRIQYGQELYKSKGMERSVVILNNSIVTLQFKRIAQDSGIYQWERYIDASSEINWEQKGIDWIEKEIDPDKY